MCTQATFEYRYVVVLKTSNVPVRFQEIPKHKRDVFLKVMLVRSCSSHLKWFVKSNSYSNLKEVEYFDVVWQLHDRMAVARVDTCEFPLKTSDPQNHLRADM